MLIDKDKDWTSFDVVNKLRFKLKYKLGIKRFKVGHAGTLDPMATGLLLVCAGKYTKAIDSLVLKEKAYLADLKLGASTPSYDAEIEEDAQYPIEHISKELVEETLNQFRGKIEQFPPMYSAIKVKGQKLYDLARKGKEVEREARPIEIYKCEITDFDLPHLQLDIECSKGTYIRSIAHDLGQALDSGAYLTGLRRTSIGNFSIDDALSVEECAKWIEECEHSENE